MLDTDITIHRIRCFPSNVSVSKDDSARSIIQATVGDSFLAILRVDEEAHYPIIFKRGELFDEDNTDWAPFWIVMSWRKNQSQWLPQFPKIILSSARTMRMLQKADIKPRPDK